MARYRLDELSPQEFQNLIASLAKLVLSVDTVTLGQGPDGGRDIIFNGKLEAFPSCDTPWEGYLIIQAKSCDDDKVALQELKKELKEFSDPTKGRQIPDYYIFATRASLTPVPVAGTRAKAEKELTNIEINGTRIKGWRIWDRNEIESYIDINPVIVQAYPQINPTKDLLDAASDLRAVAAYIKTPSTRPGLVDSSSLLGAGSNLLDIFLAFAIGFRPTAYGALQLEIASKDKKDLIVELERKVEEQERIKAYEDASNLLGLIAQLHFMDSEYDIALGKLREARDKISGIDIRDLKGKIEGFMGLILIRQGRYDDALASLKNAINLSKFDPVRQGVWTGCTGRIYLARGDYKKAEENFNKAIIFAVKSQDQLSECAWLEELGGLSLKQGKFDQAKHYLARALRISTRFGSYAEVRVRTRVGAFRRRTGQLDKSLRILRRVIVEAEKHDDKVGIAIGKIELSQVLHDKGNLLEGKKELKEAVSVCEASDDKPTLIECKIAAGIIYTGLSDYRGALKEYAGAIQEANNQNVRDNKARALALLGQIATFKGRYKAAEIAFIMAQSIFNKIGNVSGMFFVNLLEAQLLYRLGKYSDSLTLLDKCLAHFTDTGELRLECIVKGLLGSVYKALGNFKLAMENCLAVRELTLKLKDRKGLGISYAMIGLLYQSADEYQVALAWYDQASKELEGAHDKVNLSCIHGSRGQILGDLDQFDEAIDELEQAASISEQIQDRHNQMIWLGSISRLYIGQGDYKEALKFASDAVQIGIQLGNPVNLAREKLTIGLIHLQTGHLDNADREVNEAIKLVPDLTNLLDAQIFFTTAGQIALHKHAFDIAEKHLDKALEIAWSKADRTSEATVLQSQGTMYMVQGDVAKARNKFIRAHSIPLPLNDLRLKAHIKLSISETFAHERASLAQILTENPEARTPAQINRMGVAGETAERLTKDALQIADALGDKMLVSLCHGQLGQLYASIAKLDMAKHHLAIAIRKARLANCLHHEVDWLRVFAQIYMQQEKINGARTLLRKALSKAIEIDHKQLILVVNEEIKTIR